jgi:hypothetical protein
MMEGQYALPSATRRVKLCFDKNGDPAFPAVKSPECFKQDELGVLPPRDVIPVIFVPGIAGTNLRLKQGKKNVWAPPDGSLAAISAAVSGMAKSDSTRQALFEPTAVEVYADRKFKVRDNVYWLTTKEAQKRGWGALHAMSYLKILQQLEVSLNDQYSRPGFPEERGNFLLPEIGMLQYLKAGGPESSLTEQDKERERQRGGKAFSIGDKFLLSGQARKPDYARLAKEAMNAWGKTPRALSAEEIARLDDYYYPVWAYGYNWLQSNEIAAEGLLAYIDKVLAHYGKGKYFRHQGKVIVVTHSMGGLVARRAAQMLGEQGREDKILGVVHGVQPVTGAPALYRRLRAGQEVGEGFDPVGMLVASIMGWGEEEMTVQLGRAPGALQLAPTCDYPKEWLIAHFDKKTEHFGETILALPKENPYKEIYSKTTDDCWWGMVNPALIDPAGTIRKNKEKPVTLYKKAIDEAERFHNKLGLYAHPETYGFYGIDDVKYRSFGCVEWVVPEVPGHKNSREDIRNARAIGFKSGKATLAFKVFDPAYGRDNEAHATAKLSNARNQRGDGTVPEDSGTVLERLEPHPKESFAMAGFGHQDAYDNPYALQATIYFIARIIQKAAPPAPDC